MHTSINIHIGPGLFVLKLIKNRQFHQIFFYDIINLSKGVRTKSHPPLHGLVLVVTTGGEHTEPEIDQKQNIANKHLNINQNRPNHVKGK